jgi:hypothetical protein
MIEMVLIELVSLFGLTIIFLMVCYERDLYKRFLQEKSMLDEFARWEEYRKDSRREFRK